MGNSGQQASKRKDRVAAVRGSSMASGRFQDVNDGREKSFRIWHTFLIVEDWAWVGGASCECVLSVLSVYVRVRVRVCVCAGVVVDDGRTGPGALICRCVRGKGC
jgi:hypothetical protein